MKRCKCEHWQTCPTCYPQGFDEHGARKPVEIPSSREELQREITELREQVEKLTKSYDQCGRTVQEYGRTITQTELRLHEVATHCANVEQQLAALKMAREALQGIHPGNMTPMAEKNWIEALAAIDAAMQEDKP